MPPTIHDAVVLGPLNPTERKVLQLINAKPHHYSIGVPHCLTEAFVVLLVHFFSFPIVLPWFRYI
jgi:hypothetical protein